MPYNQLKGLNSSQIRIQPKEQPQPPQTPTKIPSKEVDNLLQTPITDQQLLHSARKRVQARKPEIEAQKTSAAASRANFESLLSGWQL